MLKYNIIRCLCLVRVLLEVQCDFYIERCRNREKQTQTKCELWYPNVFLIQSTPNTAIKGP
jgi:hypothetical protein